MLMSACASTPAPSATTPPPVPQPEAGAWASVRSSLPAVPLIVPTWLPPSLDRTRVEVRGIGHGPNPADPVYRVAYVSSSGATVLFALGPASDITGSAIGTRVRNSPAVLSFATNLLSDPTKPGPRQVRWQENRYVLRIESAEFTGEDLLHIAWSLDRAGAPPPKYSYVRAKPGVCAAPNAAAEETVRRLLGFVGTGDRDALMDCFSLELLGDQPAYGNWVDLPRIGDVTLRQPAALAGRIVVGAGWSFASDPGGAWGRQASLFFTLGLEDGSWRVYETGTGAYAPPP